MKEVEHQKHYKCSVCRKTSTKYRMVFIKPEILGRDYFSSFGNLCSNCAWKELYRLTNNFPIPKAKKGKPEWISRNISRLAQGDFRLTRYVEDIMFICSILINKD